MAVWLFSATHKDLSDIKSYDFRWYECVRYLEAGELYMGHIGCEQGPFIYWWGHWHKTLYGDPAQQRFHRGMLASNIVVNILLLGMILYAMRRKTGYRDYFLPIALYLTLIFSFGIGTIAHLLAAFLFFAGYFAWTFGRLRGKNAMDGGAAGALLGLLGGILMALSFLAKSTALVLFALVWLHDAFASGALRVREGTLGVSRRRIVPLAWLAIGFFSVILLTWVRYPHMFVYSLFLHFSLTTARSFGSTVVVALFSLQVRNYFVHALVLGCLYLWWKTRKLPYLISSLALGATVFSLLKNGIWVAGYLKAYIYTVAVYCFTVWALIAAVSDGPRYIKHFKRLYPAFLIALLIWPGYVDTPWQSWIDNTVFHDNARQQRIVALQRLIDDAGMQAAPSQDKVLFEYLSAKELDARYKGQRVPWRTDADGRAAVGAVDVPSHDLIGEGAFYDPTAAEPLRRMLGPLVDEWERNHPVDLSAVGVDWVADGIAKKSYGLIIVGPPVWTVMTEILQKRPEVFGGYCQVLVPDVTYFGRAGQHFRQYVFANESDCPLMAQGLAQYYQQHYAEVCDADQWVANNIVGGVLAQDGIQVPQCSSGADLLTDPSESSALMGQAWHVGAVDWGKEGRYLLGLVAIFAVFWLWPQTGKRKDPDADGEEAR